MDEETMTEEELTVRVMEAMFEDDEVSSMSTFDEAGVLTMNKGIVIRMSDGAEFQVTIVRSR